MFTVDWLHIKEEEIARAIGSIYFKPPAPPCLCIFDTKKGSYVDKIVNIRVMPIFKGLDRDKPNKTIADYYEAFMREAKNPRTVYRKSLWQEDSGWTLDLLERIDTTYLAFGGEMPKEVLQGGKVNVSYSIHS